MKIKTALMAGCFLFAAGVSAFADRIIDPLQLPDSVLKAIQTWFPGETVTLAESDWGQYDVYMSGGAEINFTLTRRWEEMSSVNGLPPTALPGGVFEAVQNAWPGALIVKIERQFRGYEVRLNNGMELYFTKDGRLIGQKYDD